MASETLRAVALATTLLASICATAMAQTSAPAAGASEWTSREACGTRATRGANCIIFGSVAGRSSDGVDLSARSRAGRRWASTQGY